MMDVREKLVELLIEFYGCDPMYYGVDALAVAQHLIANGVTVQEWIPVDDRLPEYPGHYLVCTSINYWRGGCMGINENHKYYPNSTLVGYDGSTMSVIDCYYDWEENL